MTKFEMQIAQMVDEYFTTDKLTHLLIFLKLRKFEVLSKDLTFEEFEPNCILIKDENDNLDSINLDDEVLEFNAENLQNVTWEPTDDEINELKKIRLDTYNHSLETAIEASGEELVDEWLQQAPELLQKLKDEKSAFVEDLQTIWGDVLKLLDMFLSISLDLGADFQNEFSTGLSKDDEIVFSVVNYLYGSACLVCREIYVLLSNGFADGAEARWRTLYELTIIAIFIMRSDSDTATRYQAHEKIDTFNAMRDYRKHWHPEGIEMITDKDFKKLKAERDKLIKLYGANFNTDYGWAAKALGKEKEPKITFADILNQSDLTYLHPLYKESNSNIHASSRGRFSKLGLPNGIDGILVGHSLFGIGWIARQTSFVMLAFLENLLMGYPTIENKINVEAAYKLLDKIHNGRLVAEKLLEKRASE